MALEVISAKLLQEQISLVKALVTSYKNKFNSAKIAGPKFGKIGDEILMSVKIDANHYKDFLRLLLENNISILFTKHTPANTKDIIAEYQEKKKEAEVRQRMLEIDSKPSENEKRINADKSITISDVENMVRQGNYEEIFRISRSIACQPAVMEKAQHSLAEAVRNAIDDLVVEGITNKELADGSIKKLIQIATDKKLRVARDVSFMKEAGLSAIDIAANFNETVYHLIDIANNNSLHHSVTIAAVIKLSGLIFEDEELFADEIEISLRKISVRWLNIAYDVAFPDLSDEEKEKFNKFVDFINSKR